MPNSPLWWAIYAPTENTDEEAKDDFYDSLQSVTGGIPKHDVLLMLGDFIPTEWEAATGTDSERVPLESME